MAGSYESVRFSESYRSLDPGRVGFGGRISTGEFTSSQLDCDANIQVVVWMLRMPTGCTTDVDCRPSIAATALARKPI